MATNKLVKVTNDFNSGGVLELNFDAMLSDIRKTLEGESPVLMTVDDFFMVSGTPLAINDEPTTPLSAILTAPASGTYILIVGTGSIPISNETNWTLLSEGQQATVLNNVAQVTRGLSLSTDQGLFKVTFDAIKPMVSGTSKWTSDIPRIQTSVTTNSYFSKYASSLAESSSNGASLSADTPFGSGSASYDYAKSQDSSKSTVTTYSVGTYNVNKVDIMLDKTQLLLTDDFFNALSNAASLSDGPSQFVGIVQALNMYGWYLPIDMTLGGALLTIQQSESESWVDSQSTTETFGASFKASFDGIGGGAAYNSSNTSKTTSSGSTGSDSLSFTAIGGSAADSNNFNDWAKSLDPVSAWSTSAYNQMVPSLYPLLNMGGTNLAMLYFIKNMMAQQYSSCLELEQLQPIIDVGAYITALNNLLPSSND